MTVSSVVGQYEQKYLDPLANERVEYFARFLAKDAKYIRNPLNPSEFDKLPIEAKHEFRRIAAQYALVLGIYAHSADGEIE